jgi:uncharacterized protein YbbC (DUF1343 family)
MNLPRPIGRRWTFLASLLSGAALVAGCAAGQRTTPPGERDPGVLTGLDVLVRDDFAPLAGRKIGLITNHTGVDRDGRSIIELLVKAPNVKLVALFSPEHGLKGALDEKVGDATDPLSGLRVYSLYGKTYRPTPEMLEGVDTLVYDIQDIGTRFYTYPATLGYAMEEAGKRGIRVVVLDRPNPIAGTRVFGPLNDRDGQFTAYHKTPLVHGMTIGELAQMFNAERKLNVDLQVIKMEGWRRSLWYDDTLLPWINPSPNMRSLTEATLYPAIGMLEACSLSVGRGTDTPFERLGAPGLDGRKLAIRLNSLGLKGVRFVPFRFTPTASAFKDKECGGVQILLTDRDAFDPLETGLSIARELKNLFGNKFDLDKVNNLLFNKDVLAKVKATTAPTTYRPLWQKDLDDFLARRAKYLLYK